MPLALEPSLFLIFEALKVVGRPLGILLLKIITFIFGKKKQALDTGAGYDTGSDMPLIESSEPGLLSQLFKLIISWGAIIIFNKLCHWGLTSGIPKKYSTTPWEYAKNVYYFFPKSQQDINFIVELFNRKIYGNKTISSEELDKAKKAWRRILSSSNWFLRLKVKIFYSRKYKSQAATCFISHITQNHE